jgi:hypothetical protein
MERTSMKANILTGAALILACHMAFAAPAKTLFDVALNDVAGAGRVLNVGFYGRLPPPKVVDRIIRESLDHAILIDPSKDILAAGFIGDDALSGNQHSGSLVYKASLKKVMTYDEYIGVKRATSSGNGYFVEVEDGETAPGIRPVRRWLSVTVVFPKKPSRQAAYDAIFDETRKLAARGLDVDVYVSVGNSKEKTSWEQMKDADGGYVFANYKAANKQVWRRGRLLKQL